MTLRSQAHALIGRFIADIDAIIREHATRATALALSERGLRRTHEAKRLRGDKTKLVLSPPLAGTPKAKRRAKRGSKATPSGKRAKGRRTAVPEQLTLF